MTELIAFCAGLIVGWNFIPQPQWIKDRVDQLISKIKK
jgi:hypothetical protein